MDEPWSFEPVQRLVDGAFRGRPLRATLLPSAAVGLALLGCIGVCSGPPCVTVGLRYGIWLEQCPATDLRLSANVNASDLVRGRKGRLQIDAQAMWMDGRGQDARRRSAAATRLAVDVALIGEQGDVFPGVEAHDVAFDGSTLGMDLSLPSVPDGDYRLRTRIDAGFEAVTVDAPLAFYAPALVHVMSDRPLYKPGQEVLLRAAVLRKTDSAPIEQRPGRWRVRAPDGTEMLVEKQGTGPWGISATTFPLDASADVGRWSATYETGADSDTIQFDVRPFQLPRFTVSLEPSSAWFGLGGEVEVAGTARYTSGAPVANAEVQLSVSQADGRWPMPLAWEKPVQARTDREGRFSLDLGEVPSDLIERASVRVTARVTDEAGETAFGGTALQLSHDSLQLAAITELNGGLVEGMNNRAYVRVSTPDGRPVRDAEVVLASPYDPTQPERRATTDADGVAALQLDPGAPITIVDPPPPVRLRPLTPNAPSLSSATRHPGPSVLSLQERRVFDGAHRAISACGVWAVGDQPVPIGMQVDASGAVREVLAPAGPLGACVAAASRALRFPADVLRTYELTWSVPDTLQPHLELSTRRAYGDESVARGALERAVASARRCLPVGSGTDGASVFTVHWLVRSGSRAVSTSLAEHTGSGLSPASLACVRGALAQPALDEPAKLDGMGVAALELSVPIPPGSARPRATTRTGYEFRATARSDGQLVGSGRLVFQVGAIPSLRMRATPTLTTPGTKVEIEFLRGPDHHGELPKEITLQKGTVEVARAKVDPDARKAVFDLPSDAHGFMHTEWGGARAVIYVRPTDELQLALTTDAPVYRPGETAVLTVQTRAGERPVPAAVSLAGVDQTLAQLAPLLAPDDWGRVTVRATGEEVFGFGPRALQLGQIRGENAAKAVVMKVQGLPMDAAGDQPVWSSGSRAPDEIEALTTAFYRALTALIPKVRAWEAAAKDGELMTPEQLAKLWGEVLAEADGAGAPIVDAWGRELRLGLLPPDLLGQTDPRQVVADSTKLPEDVANWPRWVAEKQP